jgi:hypothetical protein
MKERKMNEEQKKVTVQVRMVRIMEVETRKRVMDRM